MMVNRTALALGSAMGSMVSSRSSMLVAMAVLQSLVCLT